MIEKNIETIHAIITDTFPEAVTVRIFVNSEGIQVEPEYRTNASGYSMRNISGNWIKRKEEL